MTGHHVRAHISGHHVRAHISPSLPSSLWVAAAYCTVTRVQGQEVTSGDDKLDKWLESLWDKGPELKATRYNFYKSSTTIAGVLLGWLPHPHCLVMVCVAQGSGSTLLLCVMGIPARCSPLGMCCTSSRLVSWCHKHVQVRVPACATPHVVCC